MASGISIVRLGSERLPNEGLRLGTVRRPPRGVRKKDFATRNFFDVWLPVLAPSPQLVELARRATTPQHWQSFAAAYRREMAATAARTTLDALAALSHQTRFSVGCYCEDEARCHRSILRTLLSERGAVIDD